MFCNQIDMGQDVFYVGWADCKEFSLTIYDLRSARKQIYNFAVTDNDWGCQNAIGISDWTSMNLVQSAHTPNTIFLAPLLYRQMVRGKPWVNTDKSSGGNPGSILEAGQQPGKLNSITGKTFPNSLTCNVQLKLPNAENPHLSSRVPYQLLRNTRSSISKSCHK